MEIRTKDLLSNFKIITKEENLPQTDAVKFSDLLQKTIDKTGSPLERAPWIYGIVVTSLGIVVILCVIFAFIIASTTDKDTPQLLIALGSAAVGALAGLLAPSPKEK